MFSETPRREVVAPGDTVPPRVQFDKDRTFTDYYFSILYGLSYVAFLACGFFLVAKSRPRHDYTDDGTRVISEYFKADAEQCCADNDATGYVCSLLEASQTGNRRLAAGSSKFDGDEGIFDAFIDKPEIIIGTLGVTLAIALLWVVLLRYFAKPIVVIVEVLKIAGVIALAVFQDSTETRIILSVLAVAMIAYVVWAWKKILFAGKMITYSTIAMKENSVIFGASFIVKILYAGNAGIFVLFFAKSFDVVDVVQTTSTYNNYYGGFETYTYCNYVSPDYVWQISTFLGLSYLWTVAFFGQMRLSLIAGIVGSWHFHPEAKPTLMQSFKNTGKSFGTLSLASLLATIAEKLNRMASVEGWKGWMSPFICFTWPLVACLCIFSNCANAIVKMLTRFATILHVFTGDNFIKSAKHSFNILSRHFKGGFVTENTSTSLLMLSSYVFSFCVAMITWVWIDAAFDAGSLAFFGSDNAIWFILYFIGTIFFVYYPVLGLYITIIVNKYLREFERANMDDPDATNSNNIWIPPIASFFVGCLA
jgi:hypothetical protein